MTVPAITVPSYASIATAAGRMLEHHVNRLPVVDVGRLVGIVTRADLVRAFARSDEEIAADAREQLALQQALEGDRDAVGIEVRDGEAVLTGAVRRRSNAELIRGWCATSPAWSRSVPSSRGPRRAEPGHGPALLGPGHRQDDRGPGARPAQLARAEGGGPEHRLHERREHEHGAQGRRRCLC